MAETRKAKLVHHGKALTVVLPEDFGLEGDEVYVTRDEITGDVTLSGQPRRSTLASFMAYRDAHPVSDEDWDVFDAALRKIRESSNPADDRRIQDLFREDG